jgi:hypothetical protein
MKTNNETQNMLEHCTDTLVTYDNYGDPMSAGIAEIVCFEIIADLIDNEPGVYDFLSESLHYPYQVDWEYISTTVNRINNREI